MEIVDRLMTLFHWVRHPHDKPPVSRELDVRLDQIEKRLRVLSPESARRARQIVRQGR